MIEMTLAEVAEATGGTVLGDPRVRVTAPATLDSRAVEPGGLFVAIRGEHVDGHAYAPAALAAGAAAVLGSQPIPAIPSGPMVLVEDAEAALGRLAREVLRRVPDLTCLALTGSQGKTGTKDYLAAVLAGHGETVATHGNFNNELGVPLTVLRTTPTTRYLVVEMGARGIGHIAQLCAIAPPQVAACLNVGTAHLGEFGGREQIAQAKGEILEALPASGVGVLNADDPAVAAMARRTDAATVTFGTGASADVRYEITGTDPLGRPAIALTHAGRSVQVQLPQIGGFQAANAAAAAAMALAVGMPLDGVAAGLAEAGASPWRMEVHERPDGTVLLNDAYNANPQSMAAALDTLARVGEVRGARTLAVLGEMGELGDAATEEHVRLGAYAAQQGVDVVLAVGTIAADVARGTAQHPSWGGVVVSLGSTTDALAWLRESMRPEDVVLFKASRAAGLEVLATTVAREEETDR